MRRVVVGSIAIALLAFAELPVEAAAAAGRDVGPEDRYALAGGCYAVESLAAGRYVARHGDSFAAVATDLQQAEPFHFQATDLGRYLLYGAAADFLAGDSTGLVAALAPGPSADWQVDPMDGEAFALGLPATGQVLSTSGVRFHPTDGCAAFPEVEINISGPVATGATPYQEVRGFLEGHNHMMAFEFLGGAVHCGRPWHRYGVEHALVDCPDHYLLDGSGAVLENFLSNGVEGIVSTHDPVGWPTFRDWPAPDSLTHEQVYYRWLERAWRGGLRMHVNLFVDNGVLCEIYPLGQNSCDEMSGVRLQVQRIRELERYIDAQSGGPGEGWFRIVTDPFEARRVMNEGRLAVVLGIEVSELFGCSLFLGQPQCTTADIDRQLEEVYDLGVRQLELVNKFDNALAGVAGDGGTTGVVVNLGNFYGTGQFWDMASCDHGHTGVHDHDQLTLPGGIADQDALLGAVVDQFAPPGALPVYPEPHHCNTRGLSPLGAHAVEGIIERGMIVDPDHMSVLARQQTLDLLEQHGYSGVVSSHSWATPDAYPRIYALGGITTPYAGSSSGFVDAWQERRQWADEHFYWGIGYGADANGFGAQGSPRGAGAENAVTYPFEGFGGVTVDRQVSGQRVYDINVDGVAHYGLYPDWIEDLRRQAGGGIVEDMARGPEAYLQMWERALGIVPAACGRTAALDALTAGMTPEEVLAVAGQPQSRHGTTFVYCDGTVEFDAGGAMVAARSSGSGGAGGAVRALPATGASDELPLLGAA
ncbi:MAG: hypothetical protein ACRD0G_15945, partial [Acidimicrobiales bacterium]